MLSQIERAAVKDVSPVIMAYTAYGERGSDKSPLILLHGLFSRRTQWDKVARRMAEVTKSDVIAVDLRNHGDSPWVDEFSHKHIAADVQLLIKQLEAKNAHVLGHGFGGRSVVQLALEKPEIIRSIIISESTPFGTPPGYWRLATMLMLLKDIQILQDVPMETARKDLDNKLQRVVRNSIVRKLFISNLQSKKPGQNSWHFNLEALLKNMEDACRVPDLTSDTVVRIPTLFVSGEASDSLPRYHLTDLLSMFCNATVAYAGGAGYRIYQDRPIFFSDYISEYVNKH